MLRRHRDRLLVNLIIRERLIIRVVRLGRGIDDEGALLIRTGVGTVRLLAGDVHLASAEQ